MQQELTALQDVQGMYEWFQRMRDTQPVWLDENSGCWHVFRYADVNTLITDSTLFSSERRQRPFARPGTRTSPTGEKRERRTGRSIIAMDPPQHRQYRNLVSSAFTPRALSRLSHRITAITQELLDQARPAGQIDFVTDIAYPLPTMVIAEMLGVPTSDRPLFKQWADGLLNRQLSDAEFFRPDETAAHNPEMERLQTLFEEMSDYFEAKLEERRLQPRDDMMSALLAAEVDGEHLSIDDVISFCILLLLAGHVTTTNLLSQSIRCLDEHPDARAQLSQQPELIPGAIEEVLRYASPVWRLARTTTADVTMAGVTIPKDSFVFGWLASANRDERQFSEPARFDITRTPNRHIAFGHGIHFCIGAPLSRQEASIALPMIIQQLPDLQISHKEPLQLFQGRNLFGFQHLPVTFTASKPVAP
ncbi:cytochrome P450 [Tengunoibacter tsumagoiensis]|uniref:Cytochrome P450 n=1 Tax=Tengunoibacter tsumagoiensis TaxID=2014871 RepID=A0A402A666_9CHLR|nr:cytochrome P450 [Tengunoibacter tsumagoiensis]GCE14633.1 cytochrome P450 [Tengunoibacter tsumagoiensis]